MQSVTRRSLGREHGTGHLLAGLLAGDGSHRSEMITEGSSLAVGLGDAVALRLGCQDDELQVGDVVGDVGHDWSPGVSGVIEL